MQRRRIHRLWRVRAAQPERRGWSAQLVWAALLGSLVLLAGVILADRPDSASVETLPLPPAPELQVSPAPLTEPTPSTTATSETTASPSSNPRSARSSRLTASPTGTPTPSRRVDRRRDVTEIRDHEIDKTRRKRQRPPVARLTLSPDAGHAPLTVTADASGSTAGSSPIVTYSFDFDDDPTSVTDAAPISNGKKTNATHRYATAGARTITVTVTDANGLSSSDKKKIKIDKELRPPDGVVRFEPTPDGEPLQATADATGSSSPDGAAITSYTFTFDDGTVITQKEPVATHIFTTEGSHSVKLTVTDDRNLSNALPAKDAVHLQQFTVTLRVSGRWGSVTGLDGETTCAGQCHGVFAAGRRVTLRANVKHPGARFGEWSGAPDCASKLICELTVNSRYNVTARFIDPPPLPPDITVDGVTRSGKQWSVSVRAGIKNEIKSKNSWGAVEVPPGSSITFRVTATEPAETDVRVVRTYLQYGTGRWCPDSDEEDDKKVEDNNEEALEHTAVSSAPLTRGQSKEADGPLVTWTFTIPACEYLWVYGRAYNSAKQQEYTHLMRFEADAG